MNVSLTPELEEIVQSKVRSGRYRSASEVVREALRLMEAHDRRKLSTGLRLSEKSRRAFNPPNVENWRTVTPYSQNCLLS